MQGSALTTLQIWLDFRKTQVFLVGRQNVWPLIQAYFFTGFPASIESGISETLSLGGNP